MKIHYESKIFMEHTLYSVTLEKYVKMYKNSPNSLKVFENSTPIPKLSGILGKTPKDPEI